MSKDTNQITSTNELPISMEKKHADAVISSLVECFAKKNVKIEGLSKKKVKKVIAERERGAKIFLKSFENADVLKTLLAAQMYEIHEQQQKMAKRADSSDYIQHRQMYINSLIKLSNVFIQQTILMQKLTGNGQQKVIVEHVHVHNGGQAIVGNIENTRGKSTHEEK